MLRPNLMNCFASVRYCNSCCTAGVSGNLWSTSFHSWGTEQLGISIPRACSDTLVYFYVQYPKRMLFRFNPTYALGLLVIYNEIAPLKKYIAGFLAEKWKFARKINRVNYMPNLLVSILVIFVQDTFFFLIQGIFCNSWICYF